MSASSQENKMKYVSARQIWRWKDYRLKKNH